MVTLGFSPGNICKLFTTIGSINNPLSSFQIGLMYI